MSSARSPTLRVRKLGGGVLLGASLLAAQGLHQLARAGSPPPSAPGPDASLLSVATLDRPTTAATLCWIRAVSAYVGTGGAERGQTIRRSVEAAGQLDPRWRTPWVLGALMLGHIGEVDLHEDLLRSAIQAHPTDPWFPWALGMSRYLRRRDPAGAATWLEWAAGLPGSDELLGRAAQAMRARASAGGAP